MLEVGERELAGKRNRIVFRGVSNVHIIATVAGKQIVRRLVLVHVVVKQKAVATILIDSPRSVPTISFRISLSWNCSEDCMILVNCYGIIDY